MGPADGAVHSQGCQTHRTRIDTPLSCRIRVIAGFLRRVLANDHNLHFLLCLCLDDVSLGDAAGGDSPREAEALLCQHNAVEIRELRSLHVIERDLHLHGGTFMSPAREDEARPQEPKTTDHVLPSILPFPGVRPRRAG